MGSSLFLVTFNGGLKIREIEEILMEQVNDIEIDGEPQPLFNDKIASIDTIIE